MKKQVKWIESINEHMYLNFLLWQSFLKIHKNNAFFNFDETLKEVISELKKQNCIFI